jgi:hypothetical protein
LIIRGLYMSVCSLNIFFLNCMCFFGVKSILREEQDNPFADIHS